MFRLEQRNGGFYTIVIGIAPFVECLVTRWSIGWSIVGIPIVGVQYFEILQNNKMEHVWLLRKRWAAKMRFQMIDESVWREFSRRTFVACLARVSTGAIFLRP